MSTVREIIVVEGRYDKNAVLRAVSGTVIETSGFGILSDKEKLALLRLLAEKRGIVILTDSDRAGFFIRGRLRGILGPKNVKHAYIPDIEGVERRKSSPSKEGKLGVEGMTADTIITALRRAGATFEEEPTPEEYKSRVTKADLYDFGLSGGAYSAKLRRVLAERLRLPVRLSANGLLDVLGALYTRDELYDTILAMGFPNARESGII